MFRAFKLRAVSLAVLVVLSPGASSGRELYWKSLEVTAELAGDGRLHVREEHMMVFDGSWNGGERAFAVGASQKLELHSIARLVDGVFRPLTQGDVDAVDHWDWFDGKTVRWRSRLPEDPPFSSETLVYALDYSLSNILLIDGDDYALDHDFAFAEREGRIERLSVALKLAPEWRLRDPVELEWTRESVEPGFSLPVDLRLEHSSLEHLSGVLYPIDDRWRHVALAATLAGIAVILLQFWRRETRSGRFEPVAAPSDLDPAWIEEHVRSWPPEQVGALWDESVGAPEVAALIARWTTEGKVESQTLDPGGLLRRANMQLEIVPRSEFSSYGGNLQRKLFFDGGSRVTTAELRKHYRTKGFDPAGIIRRGIESAIKQRLGNERGPAKPKAWRTVALFAAGLAWLVVALVRLPESALSWGLVALLTGLPTAAVGFAGAYRWRRRVERLKLGIAWVLGPAVALAFLYWWLPSVLSMPGIRLTGLAALACVALGTASFFFNQASTRVPRPRLEQRRRLAVIRRWWKEELGRPLPRLRDEDLPYLIALELQDAVDDWSTRFGRSPSASVRPADFSASGSTGSGSWTGGGGAFGGAGATGAWTAAVTGLAGGVAAASSSSGGGGGGGGSSSGGGGGGGW